MAVSLFKLQGISKSFDKHRILHNVDLEMGEGESVALCAPSGAGKSTLLLIAGLMQRPTSGNVYFEGQRISSERQRRALRAKTLGFVFQFHHLVPELKVVDNVALPLRLSGVSAVEARKKVMSFLRALDMEDHANRYPSTLSGGESQRVAVVRAMVHTPKILLADEPTGNLDERTSRRVFNFLREIADKYGTALFVITHDLKLAGECDRVVTLRGGRLEDEEVSSWVP